MTRAPQVRSRRTLETILDSAERVLARDGSTRLTLDAVATESGVSKGGVQHHFHSKEALVTAMVLRKLAAVVEDMEAEERALADHPFRIVLSMMRHGARQWTDEEGFPPALLLATAFNSDSLSDVKGFLDAKIKRIRAETDNPDRSIVFVFAALGLLLTRALGLSSLDDQEGLRLFEAMEELVKALE